MYEHNGQLLVRTDHGYEIVTLQLNEDGGYTVTPTGKQYSARPQGATRTTVQDVIVQHGLVAGDVFPAPEQPSNPEGSLGQPKGRGGVHK